MDDPKALGREAAPNADGVEPNADVDVEAAGGSGVIGDAS